jgi:hypothetical protein
LSETGEQPGWLENSNGLLPPNDSAGLCRKFIAAMAALMSDSVFLGRGIFYFWKMSLALYFEQYKDV